MATATSSYIPLAERSIWSDVQPIPQDDAPDALVPIMYSQEYKDAMDYFRAVSARKEYSDRALELTESILRMNASHYTVWGYRMTTLLVLKKELNEELELMNSFARENLKSYQVWHHRLLLLTHISPEHPTEEIDYIHESLLPDAKNYHTWAYLHWLYSHFSSLGRISEKEWSEELRWCEEMIRVDGRNNSAWGWRWFLRISRPGAEGIKDDGKEEIEYTLRAIHRIPHNVSAWNYLRGSLKYLKKPLTPLLPAILPYTEREDVTITAKEETNLPMPSNPLPRDTPLPISYALEFLAESYQEQGLSIEAAAVYTELSEKYDRMRSAYWAYRAKRCVV
ncbi:protein farnesyltransferase/geranylgeranyltransferase type-1 subunit alpha [Tremella mesenterica]|uniref:Protein farnesyltransferase/geranylgeranyltransferase type-1 subunit alpha n=1 Tax=Tremella mesenterica TaxID=5217 RepID=A0A4Q1BSV1_TREME|nr:protein farnesyltransferase/geranylgeranyltransferase type-1 subunit alpha [Tremella mesenterica]